MGTSRARNQQYDNNLAAFFMLVSCLTLKMEAYVPLNYQETFPGQYGLYAGRQKPSGSFLFHYILLHFDKERINEFLL
jgi:hypothetical protein